MRVIAGSARRTQLKTPAGDGTRPTTDRIKETLFNILQPDLPGCVFLDLFSGSGGIGIEALSRGAKSAAFVENDREALACIQYNLKKARLEEKASVLAGDYEKALSQLDGMGQRFDIVFLDPPYRKGYERRALEQLAASSLIHGDSLVIAESSLDMDTEDLEAAGFQVCRVKEYKTNKHIFLRKA